MVDKFCGGPLAIPPGIDVNEELALKALARRFDTLNNGHFPQGAMQLITLREFRFDAASVSPVVVSHLKELCGNRGYTLVFHRRQDRFQITNNNGKSVSATAK